MKIKDIIKRMYYRIRYFNNNVEYARKLGVQIGEKCILVDRYSFGSEPYLVTIGNHVLISSNVSFFTHDGAVYTAKGLTGKNDLWKYGRITIKDNASVMANCTILPGVTIGENSIVGAGSVVTKSIPDNQVWGGNPAHFIKNVEDYVNKIEREKTVFDMDNYRRNKKNELLSKL